MTDNISGVNQEVSYKKKRENKAENHRNLLISSIFHSPVHSPVESAFLPADLSYSSDRFDLLALSPTKQATSLARRLLSSKSTLSTLISQPFQYSYWLLIGLFLTACSNSNGSGGRLPADPASVEPPYGDIDIEYVGGARVFSKEFNDAYLDEVGILEDGDTAPAAITNVALPVEFSSGQSIDFAASLRYSVTFIDASGQKTTLDYTHAGAVGEDGNALEDFPFFAIIETESSGFLVANHRYDFDSDRGEDYDITLIAVTDSGEIYESLEIQITGNEHDNILEGGAGWWDGLDGGAGDDIFVAHAADGETDTITDFTSGEDKIRVEVADLSAVTDLGSLSTALSITQATSSSGVTLTFDRGNTGADASDYMLVLEGVTTSLTFTDFEVI